eukprot:CAMPEP_0204196466 /NCGR_PEP_ID=MMETSP0361-20130328/63845_1 /ASSEMBLY_ACC=CAM_ASM_000343 /TAXON_ID=268821 /ORGANISM="Scrippsiella Hangoei, Strain SHTV-5" /LENGTH=57 /DNA_ID=CAMNT_0051158219 /DNA_START=33 /DNA_END=206 /DNA_ORIENTATION=-
MLQSCFCGLVCNGDVIDAAKNAVDKLEKLQPAKAKADEEAPPVPLRMDAAPIGRAWD